MTQTRFIGCIHSIIGHIILISPHGDPATQERCFIDDFTSIMPIKSEGGGQIRFCFNVVPDRVPAMPYYRWLGNEMRDDDRYGNLAEQIANLTDTIHSMSYAKQTKAFNTELAGFAGLAAFDDPEISAAELAAKLAPKG